METKVAWSKWSLGAGSAPRKSLTASGGVRVAHVMGPMPGGEHTPSRAAVQRLRGRSRLALTSGSAVGADQRLRAASSVLLGFCELPGGEESTGRRRLSTKGPIGTRRHQPRAGG